MNQTSISVNGRDYCLPNQPLAVICIDGCADEYLSTSIAKGYMPNVARMCSTGHRSLVRGALPSFTNVNNAAMVTGCPPSETGIGGNYIIDPDTGEEVMTNSPAFLRKPTILAAAATAGRRVAMVTAKDKLRKLLSKDLDGIAFSSERLDEAIEEDPRLGSLVETVGPRPEIYSGDASTYVVKAGVQLIASGEADFCYLTLTDYMQHKYAPEECESLEFYSELDQAIGDLVNLNCVVGITADHGMNAKCSADGRLNIVYLQTILANEFGEGIKVICPITDPYVVHHGALGSAVTVYLPDHLSERDVADFVLNLAGIAEVHTKASAVNKLELPADRIGDLFVLSNRDFVVGRTEADHDLSQLNGKLRSHGGRYEEMVPLLLSHPLTSQYQAKAQADPRNFDVFDFVCNGLSLH